MRNILTIDVEEWFHGNDFDLPRERFATLESRVERQTDFLLSLLAGAGSHATFFILGCVAQTHPALVRRIHDAGHEVASHGHYHDLVYRLSRSEFAAQLRDSTSVLSGITGEPVTAFRAPSWSIVEKNLWALDVLRDGGLTVDSSIFPMRTGMFGIKNARLDIHTIAGRLTEYPPAAVRVGGLTIPVAGGIFFRLLPYAFTAAALRRINGNGRPAVVYLHPWELDPDHPRVPGIPRHRTWYHYHRLTAARSKYQRLLKEFEFGSIRDHRRALENA